MIIPNEGLVFGKIVRVLPKHLVGIAGLYEIGPLSASPDAKLFRELFFEPFFVAVFFGELGDELFDIVYFFLFRGDKQAGLGAEQLHFFREIDDASVFGGQAKYGARQAAEAFRARRGAQVVAEPGVDTDTVISLPDRFSAGIAGDLPVAFRDLPATLHQAVGQVDLFAPHGLDQVTFVLIGVLVDRIPGGRPAETVVQLTFLRLEDRAGIGNIQLEIIDLDLVFFFEPLLYVIVLPEFFIQVGLPFEGDLRGGDLGAHPGKNSQKGDHEKEPNTHHLLLWCVDY